MTVPIEFLYLLVLLGATVLFVTEWLPMEVTTLLIIVSLAFTDVLTPAQTLSGFSNLATVTIAAMFVLSAGLVRTGALENVTIYLADFSRGKPRRLLVLLGLTVPFASAFINNTPVVAMMVPVVTSLSLRYRLSPSKLLIPVSYFAILGGTLTLIGTSTNILVNELGIAAGQAPLRMFSFFPLGFLFVSVGGLMIIFLSDRLLPDRLAALEGEAAANRVYLARFSVPANSSLIGKKAKEAFRRVRASSFRHRQLSRMRRLSPPPASHFETELQLLSHRRADGSHPSNPPAEEVFQARDSVVVSGVADDIVRFKSQYTMRPYFGRAGDAARRVEEPSAPMAVQAVVLSNSTLIGRSLQELETTEPCKVAVLGWLAPSPEATQISPEREIRSGDALLLEGNRADLLALRDQHQLTFIEGRGRLASQFRRNHVALLILGAVVAGGALTNIPIVLLALAGALGMILTGCLSVPEAFRSLDSRTLLLMAGTIPLGLGMQAAGITDRIVPFLLQGALLSNLMWTVASLYLLASLLTQLVSNAAVAVLFVPIALGLADTMQVEPVPLLMAIAFGASASFMSPTGYQTNAIVMEAGGYTYTDFMRLGAPLQIAMWLLATVCIPFLYA